MSKGPGNRQRQILEALQNAPAVELRSLYETNTAAEASAFCRAAVKLRESGKIDWRRFHYCGRRVIVMRPGRVMTKEEVDHFQR
jgi:hypothetical protein